MKSRQVNSYLGKLILKLLARIGEWHQNLSAKIEMGTPQVLDFLCERLSVMHEPAGVVEILVQILQFTPIL